MKKLFRLVLVSASFIPAAWCGEELTASGEAVVPDQYIVRLREGVTGTSSIEALVPGGRLTRLAGGRHHLLRNASRKDIARLAKHANVDFVEPDRIRTLEGQMNDPQLADQWALGTVKALQAWDLLPTVQPGSPRIKVAVLDTGADCTHPDFVNAGGTSTDVASGGQFSFALSQAIVPTTIQSPACPWQDDNGHGTHTAGTVAAASGNGIGVSALGYPVQLLIYKVLDSKGRGSDSDIAHAIIAATDAGANVISISIGGPGYSQTLQDAVTYAWSHNVVVVVAAGNSNTDSLQFPASSNYVLTVAATGPGGEKASFSNYGNSVRIAAPGVQILSTLPSYPTGTNPLNYGVYSGTSMATPQVAGLAGLLWTAKPNNTAGAIIQRIQQSASGTEWTATQGYGVIDAYAALSGAKSGAGTGAITGQVVNANGVAARNAQVTVMGQTLDNPDAGLFRFAGLAPGNYTVAVTAFGVTRNVSVGVSAGADTQISVQTVVPTGELTGIVSNAGSCADGVIVEAIDASGVTRASTVTGPDGSYSLQVPEGFFTVRASNASGAPVVSNPQAVGVNSASVVNLGWGNNPLAPAQ